MPIHQVGEAAVVAALVVDDFLLEAAAVAGDEVPLKAEAPGEAAVVVALVVVAGDAVPLKAAAPGALIIDAHAWLPSSGNAAQLSFLLFRLAYLSLALFFL